VFFAFVLAETDLSRASKLPLRGALWGLLRPSGVFCSQNRPDRGAFWGLSGSLEIF